MPESLDTVVLSQLAHMQATAASTNRDMSESIKELSGTVGQLAVNVEAQTVGLTGFRELMETKLESFTARDEALEKAVFINVTSIGDLEVRVEALEKDSADTKSQAKGAIRLLRLVATGVAAMGALIAWFYEHLKELSE